MSLHKTSIIAEEFKGLKWAHTKMHHLHQAIGRPRLTNQISLNNYY